MKYDDSPEVKCGRHSGFPECCVAFYVLVWLPEVMHSIRGHKVELVYKRHLQRWGYIPCPHCLLTGNRVTVKPCPDSSCPWFKNKKWRAKIEVPK